MTNVVDPWQHILKSFYQEYEILNSIINQYPYIKLKLYKFGRHTWAVCLTEQWPDEIDIRLSTKKLDDSISWCEKTLETWKNCKRQSWDTWSFDSKKNAEKFITYYNIACPQ